MFSFFSHIDLLAQVCRFQGMFFFLPPTFLLVTEATSALDSNSERQVQEAMQVQLLLGRRGGNGVTWGHCPIRNGFFQVLGKGSNRWQYFSPYIPVVYCLLYRGLSNPYHLSPYRTRTIH